MLVDFNLPRSGAFMTNNFEVYLLLENPLDNISFWFCCKHYPLKKQ